MAWYDDWLKNRIKTNIDDLLKADGVSTPAPGIVANGDKVPDVPEDGHEAEKLIGRKAVIDDPYFDNLGQQVNYKHKMSRLSNRTLKEVSLRDWLVSSIIQARVDTLVKFSRPQHRKFEEGFRIIKKNDKDPYTEDDLREISELEDFIYHCGRREGTPHSDRMLFGEFLKLVARDSLTFGHVAVEKIKTRAGGLHRFRPLPAESVYLINKKLSKEQLNQEVLSQRQGFKPGNNDPSKDYQINQVPIEYYKYVQVSYDNRPLANFGDEDLIFKLLNPQNFADSNGYCYSPVEMAVINITNHLNVENYNANFFTHGYASRGILHLKGTVTQAQLMNFRRQFYNTISGQQHAWRTPIVAGLEEVQWVPMSASAKEMEYINFNNHLMRIICAQFQIDPMELGLDYLISGTGRAPMQQASNEYKINFSRERGLHPLMLFVEDMMNSDLLPSIDIEISKKYKFVFTGYTDATPQTEIAQMQAEMTVWKSMNDLLVQAQKDAIDSPAANLPMNQAFWALVEKNYTRGEIREYFFKDKGASKRKELQYIPGDPAFMGWQQLILSMEQAKEQKSQMKEQQEQQQQMMQAQAEAQQQQAEMENRHKEAEHDREEEKHEMEMKQMHAEAAGNAVRAGGTGHNPLTEAAKQFGASKAPVIAGTPVKNPLNYIPD
jgi:hypothetical protein